MVDSKKYIAKFSTSSDLYAVVKAEFTAIVDHIFPVREKTVDLTGKSS